MPAPSTRRVLRTAAVGIAMAVTIATLAACSANTTSSNTSTSGSGTGSLTIWAHQGQDSETAALQTAVADFNLTHPKIKAKLTLMSGDTYTAMVTSTPASKLPDILEVDGPTLASYVFNEKLAPLSSYVSAKTLANATPGSIAEGTSNGKLYGLAMFDSALGVFGNKKMLDAAGVKYPTSLANAWTADQFTAALKTLGAASPTGKSLDIHEDYGLGGEWGTYAFSPLLWSAGGNLISNNKASGVLDSSASVAALTTFASWKPFVDANADGKAFAAGRVALGWGGHWMYPDYSKALGADLVALPLPDFGKGTKTGAGSWTWGIGASTKNGKAAGQFIDTLLADKSVTAMTTANGAPPATKSALAANTLYSPTGALALWAQQITLNCGTKALTSACVSVDRPVTAGYPVITSKFSAALSAIFGGADVKTSLATAAKAIDQSYSDNQNYK